MSLAVWHLGQTLQLTPRLMTDLAEVRQCLLDSDADPDLLTAAVQALSGMSEPLQAYAVPWLVALLERGAEESAQRAAAACLGRVTAGVLPAEDLISLAAMTQADRRRLIAKVTITVPRRPVDDALNLVEAAPVLLALSLVRGLVASRQLVEAPDEAMVADLLSTQDRPTWLTAAAEGVFGKRAQVLAAQVLIEGGDSPGEISKQCAIDRPGAWVGDPLLMRLSLDIQSRRGGRRTPSERVQWLLTEAIELGWWTQNTRMKDGAVEWTKVAPSHEPTARIALWQAVAWELAADLDPKSTTAGLAPVWGSGAAHPLPVLQLDCGHSTPELRLIVQSLAELRPWPRGVKPQVRLHEHGGDGLLNRGTPAWKVAHLFSPWLDRTRAIYSAEDKKSHGGVGSSVSLLRLLANARTLDRLIVAATRAEGAVPEYLVDLWFNLRDVLSNPLIRGLIGTLEEGRSLQTDRYGASTVVLALALGAKEDSQRLGAGQLGARIPFLLVERLEQAQSSRGCTQQVTWLYRQAAPLAAGNIVVNVLAGEISLGEQEDAAPWFTGGPTSPAARLARLVMGPVWDAVGKRDADPSRSMQETPLMIKEVFPEVFERRASAWDWTAVYGSRHMVGRNLFLLSPHLSLSEWDTLAPLQQSKFDWKGAFLAGLTGRVQVLLAEAEGHQRPNWVTDWLEALERVNHPYHLARSVRSRLIQLLDQPARDHEEQLAQQAALRSVMEFSDESIRHQDLIGQALARYISVSDTPFARQLVAEWLWFLAQPLAELRTGQTGPWNIQQRSRLIWLRERLRSDFLLNVIRELPHLAPSLVAILDELNCRKMAGFSLDVSDDVAPHDTEVSQLREGEHRAWGTRHSLATVDDRGRQGGILAGLWEGELPHERIVNVGTETPLRLSLRQEDVPGAGYGVSVIVDGSGVRPQELPLPRERRVVQVEVHWNGDRLTVSAPGLADWTPSALDGLLGLWLPDAGEALQGSAKAKCFAIAEPQGWAPFPLSADEFLLEHLATHGVTCRVVVVAERGDGWWVLATGFGRHYLVPDEWFSDALRAEIDDKRHDARRAEQSLSGLIVNLQLELGSGTPQLLLASASEDGNLAWAGLFAGGGTWRGELDGDRWVIAADQLPAALRGRPVVLNLGAEPPRGFQRTVRVRVPANGWSTEAQRRGVVDATVVMADRLPVPEFADPDALARLLETREGDVFTLRELTGRESEGFYPALTSDGVPVSVAADSVSLLPGLPPPSLIQGRRVFVERLRRRAPVLSGATESYPIPQLADADKTMGLVAGLGTDEGTAELWLLAPRAAVLVEVPLKALSQQSVALGDRVVGRMGVGGWTFTVERLTLIARARWSLSSDAADGAEPLDIVTLDGRRQLILQSRTEPVLYRRSPDALMPEHLSVGVPPTAKRVRRIAKESRPMSRGAALDVVAVSAASGTIVGHSEPGHFAATKTWIDVNLILERPPDGPVGEWDARRMFVPGTVRTGGDRLDAGTVSVMQPGWLERFDEWSAEGGGKAFGVLLDPRTVRLNDITVPDDPHREHPSPVEVIPLARAARTLLRGKPYDRSSVRLQVWWDHSGWQAHYDPEPLTLAEFSGLLRMPGGPSQIWFAGRTPEDRLRFEWGFGWWMELDRGEVEARQPPFFGDRLDGVVVERRHEAGNTRLVLTWRRLTYSAERNVLADAADGMVHQVEVMVKKAGDRTYLNVQGTRTRVRRSAPMHNLAPTMPQRLFHAKLDPDSEKAILELLGQEAQDGVGISILARAERNQRISDTVPLKLVAVLPRSAGGSRPALRSGDCIELIAGEIRATANDFFLSLTAPPELLVGDLTGQVHRRSFSLREAALREAYHRGPDDLRGRSFLVRLVEEQKPGFWKTSLIEVPPRRARDLLDWAASDPDQAYVTVARPRGRTSASDGFALVEPRPGIIGSLSIEGKVPPAGSLCRLHRSSQGRGVLEVVVPGDIKYVPPGGRPVEMLLKDNVFATNPRGQLGMTVAGLPGLSIQHQGEALRLRDDDPPRLGWLSSQGKYLVPDSNHGFSVGRLANSGPEIAALRGHEAQMPTPAVEGWPGLSFMDAASEEVLAHSVAGKWFYHDRATKVAKNGTFVERSLPCPVSTKVGPLFFDQDGLLRYNPKDFRQYGYPTDDILERGLPGKVRRFPVAGSSNDGGLWIELAPGRIVEVSGALLHAPCHRNSALQDFVWQLFAPGDTVQLDFKRDPDGGQATLQLRSWTPGPRGWFDTSRALLTAHNGDTGCAFGGGVVTLAWSGERVDGTVWLGPRNEISPFADDICVGDVVSVGWIDGQLGVHGATSWEIAWPTTPWDGFGWLHEQLTSQMGRAWEILGNHVPFRVVGVEGRTISVRPAFRLPGNGRLAARILGVLDDESALLRCGSAVFSADLDALLPGVPPATRTTVAEGLVARSFLMWLYRADGVIRVPADGRTVTGHEVSPIFAAPDGLVVLSRSDLGVDWLPLEQLGWTAGVDAEVALQALRKRGAAIEAIVASTGVWSVLHSPEGRRVERAGAAREDLRVRLRVALPDRADGIHRFLATVASGASLLVVESESQQALDDLLIVTPRQVDGELRGIPASEYRTPIALSPWLVAALREHRSERGLDLAAMRCAVQERAERLNQALNSPTSAGVSEDLVRVLGEWRSAATWDPSFEAPLLAWLGSSGRGLLLQETGSAVDDLGDELAVALAGALLLDAFGRASQAPNARKLAVHAVRAIGLAASASVHQELLLTHWWAAEAPSPRLGAWTRFNRLDLGGRTHVENPWDDHDPYVSRASSSSARFDGTLTRSQAEMVRYACRGALLLYANPDPAVAVVARQLLFSIGVVTSAGDLLSDARSSQLRTLVDIARGLTPGSGVAVAQKQLTEPQIATLSPILSVALGGGVPLSLIRGQSGPAISEVTKEWARGVIEQFT